MEILTVTFEPFEMSFLHNFPRQTDRPIDRPSDRHLLLKVSLMTILSILPILSLLTKTIIVGTVTTVNTVSPITTIPAVHTSDERDWVLFMKIEIEAFKIPVLI